MVIKRSQLSAAGISLLIHVAVLGLLATMKLAADNLLTQVPIETIFEEERVQEEFSQELDQATDIAETVNVVAGGSVTGAVGGSELPAINQQAIEQSETLMDPEVTVNAGPVDIAGFSDLGTDLGEGEVAGEVGAAVEGYGAALSRIAQEIIRHMRQRKVLVVWLFDESNSMKDDQQDIKQQFHKIYEELGIVQEQDQEFRKNRGKGQEILDTMIFGFGEKLHRVTKSPTAELKEIRQSIDRIEVDESGTENTMASINAVLEEFGPLAKRQNRKLMVVVVSDESGSDGQFVDGAVEKAKRFEAPVYVLGREAVFGYPYARIRVQDKETQLWHWLPIDRGPESAYVEALQFDGLHERWDSYSSGFGPYEQVRLAKESGGIFFVLPSEEENIVGQEAADKRNFYFLDLKEYVPDLRSRKEYILERDKSKFRGTIAAVIKILDPSVDKEISIREHHYPIGKEDFAKEAQIYLPRGVRDLALLSKSIEELEKVKSLRATEESPRWRANYDLILAQCYGYRVRLFQALLAIYKHNKDMPEPKSKQSNQWFMRRVTKKLVPDPEVVKITKVDIEELNKQEQTARQLYADVIKNHPRTPWSNRAEYELSVGFGIEFYDVFWDPRYNRPGIKLPKQ